LAVKEKVNFLEKNTTGIRAPHFALYVKDYLVGKYGESMVEEGGLKVTTTLNFKIQEKAEKIISNFAPNLEKSFNASNTAMVAIDPKTGDILMMVGSRNYFEKGYGNFNIATAYRQPGSTFKPFVYATAFMKGYTPDTVLFDVKTEFSSQCTPLGLLDRIFRLNFLQFFIRRIENIDTEVMAHEHHPVENIGKLFTYFFSMFVEILFEHFTVFPLKMLQNLGRFKNE
jgi:membrane carboxypeptidase/penicillin-binding protein